MNITLHPEIRQYLINEMAELEKSNLDCFSCSSAECCTFVKNSMMITPLESVELYSYLDKNNRFNDQLRKTLKDNIAHYRLDKELPSDGVRLFSRRSYTCPFLIKAPKGCSISRKSKPYGCLGFNATDSGQVDSSSCRSNQQLLVKTQNEFESIIENISNEINLLLTRPFKKLPIPNALLVIDTHWELIKTKIIE